MSPYDRFPRNPTGSGGLVQKIVAVATTLLLFGLALMFSVVLFAVVLTVGAAVWGYMWWKTRALRKAMRERMDGRMGGSYADSARAQPPGGGMVIEGEVIREVEIRDR